MSEIRTDPRSAAQVSAAFTQMVMQQANMTLMLLGKIANPATGQMMRDLPAAQYFIEQLEMIQVKTQGNLVPEEAALLKQSLMSLRLAFVEAVDAPTASASVPPAV
jgi:hypothetical protein